MIPWETPRRERAELDTVKMRIRSPRRAADSTTRARISVFPSPDANWSATPAYAIAIEALNLSDEVELIGPKRKRKRLRSL